MKGFGKGNGGRKGNGNPGKPGIFGKPSGDGEGSGKFGNGGNCGKGGKGIGKGQTGVSLVGGAASLPSSKVPSGRALQLYAKFMMKTNIAKEMNLKAIF
ncbi:hypothetical protein ACH5RR_015898 [Cinchona calisaya]|uniref:Uncharacterized protein n=1 Tax=Cinchona calisaya TaxID=153742 RepID=A0ABD2ZUH2_9GENT